MFTPPKLIRTPSILIYQIKKIGAACLSRLPLPKTASTDFGFLSQLLPSIFASAPASDPDSIVREVATKMANCPLDPFKVKVEVEDVLKWLREEAVVPLIKSSNTTLIDGIRKICEPSIADSHMLQAYAEATVAAAEGFEKNMCWILAEALEYHITDVHRGVLQRRSVQHATPPPASHSIG